MKELEVGGHKVILDDDIAQLASWVGLRVMGAGQYGRPRLYTRMRPVSTLIVPARKGYVVDHINGNVMDNRRENLQRLSCLDNIRKRRLTEHPGVTGSRAKPGVYRVLCADRKRRVFRDMTDAKRAADQCRRSLGIRGMPLNFPEVGEHYWDGRLRSE